MAKSIDCLLGLEGAIISHRGKFVTNVTPVLKMVHRIGTTS